MTLTSTQKQALIWLAIGLVAAWLLWKLAPVLTPFVIAAVLSYVLQPIVEMLSARRVPRVLAVVLVETLALLAAVAVLLLLVPVLIKELPLLKAQLPPLLDRLDQSFSPWLRQFGIQVSLDVASLKGWLAQLLDTNSDEWMAAALSSARIGGSVLLSVVGNAILVPVA